MDDDSTRKPTRLVLLDRDGVVNAESPDYIKSASEWLPLPGSLAAIAQLNAAGIDTALCSNQAGIGRGLISLQDHADIHVRFNLQLTSRAGHMSLWRYCPHHPDEHCSCRKPATGMLLDCMQELGQPATACAFVGDSLKDMQAAIAADVEPILVRTGNGERAEQEALTLGVRCIVDDLAAAAELLIQRNRECSP